MFVQTNLFMSSQDDHQKLEQSNFHVPIIEFYFFFFFKVLIDNDKSLIFEVQGKFIDFEHFFFQFLCILFTNPLTRSHEKMMAATIFVAIYRETHNKR